MSMKLLNETSNTKQYTSSKDSPHESHKLKSELISHKVSSGGVGMSGVGRLKQKAPPKLKFENRHSSGNHVVGGMNKMG